MAKVNLGPVSAYAIAVKNGFEGIEQEWLESLKGKDAESGADWNAAESEAGYIANKPFYETSERKLIWFTENTIIEGPVMMGVQDGYANENGYLRVSSIISGETYVYIVDGVEYVGTAEWSADETSEGGNGFNLKFYDHDDGHLKFQLTTYSNVVYAYFEDDPPASFIRHSVALYHLSADVKTVDEKYIPDTIARKTDITWEALPDKPFGEVMEHDEIAQPYNIVSAIYDRSIPITSKFKPEEILHVVVDGVTYSGVPENNPEENDYKYNYTFIAGDCSFNWYKIRPYGYVQCRVTISGEHKIDSMYYLVPATKLIDSIYLPKAAAVADATDAPTAENFNALLASLRAAGYLSE